MSIYSEEIETAMSRDSLQSIHHITAISGEPARNALFYRELLGLRLVKKTVNFDDPQTYHLYFGDEAGSPGTILTFFPWAGARRGRRGVGMIETVAFAVPRGSLPFWRDRFAAAKIAVSERPPRFAETGLRLADPDGMQLDLVESDRPAQAGRSRTIVADHAIIGLHAATERVQDFGPTHDFITSELGFLPAGEDADVRRYRPGTEGNDYYELIADSDAPVASGGRGTVHHIAWMTPNLEASERWRTRLVDAGHHVSPVMDRKYFRSIYFREPGGVLFELATNGPGFAVDESPDALGSTLMLPEQYEAWRKNIEAILPPLDA